MMWNAFSPLYTNSNKEGFTRIQHCDDCFDILGTPGYYHFLWCVASIDHYNLIGRHIVQHEIGIEWQRRDRTLIEWERIIQLHILFLVLPNTSIILNWLADMIIGTPSPSPSTRSSMVNWSSNSPFNRMILSSISRNRNINQPNRDNTVCRYPPPIDSSGWWDRQWLSWWADCCSGWQSSDRKIGPTMNTLGSLGDLKWNQSRSNRRTKQVEWPYIL